MTVVAQMMSKRNCWEAEAEAGEEGGVGGSEQSLL